jgi:hypothetical protein
MNGNEAIGRGLCLPTNPARSFARSATSRRLARCPVSQRAASRKCPASFSTHRPVVGCAGPCCPICPGQICAHRRIAGDPRGQNDRTRHAQNAISGVRACADAIAEKARYGERANASRVATRRRLAQAPARLETYAQTDGSQTRLSSGSAVTHAIGQLSRVLAAVPVIFAIFRHGMARSGVREEEGEYPAQRRGNCASLIAQALLAAVAAPPSSTYRMGVPRIGMVTRWSAA